MTNISRRYYERELGAGLGPSPSMKEHFGYSEPLRRFIQRESFEPQANEIPNTMPSWLPGDDYMTNFKVGDPNVSRNGASASKDLTTFNMDTTGPYAMNSMP